MRAAHTDSGGTEFNIATAFAAGTPVEGRAETALGEAGFVGLRVDQVLRGELRNALLKDAVEFFLIRQVLQEAFQTGFSLKRGHARRISATAQRGSVKVTFSPSTVKSLKDCTLRGALSKSL